MKKQGVFFTLFGKDKASGPIGRVRGALGGLRQQATVTGRAMSMHRVGDGMRGLTRSVATLRGQVSGLGLGFGALFAGGGLVGLRSMINGTAQAADELAKFGRRVGLTAREVAGYHHAMAQAGGGTGSEFDIAVRTMTKNIGDAVNGTGEARVVFKAMGIDLKDASGKVKGTNQVLAELANKMAKIEDPAQRQAVAMRIFGESGGKMALILGDGADAMARLTAEGRKLSGMTAQLAKDSEAYNDEQDKLGKSFGFLRNGIAAKLLPLLTPLTVRIREFVMAASPAVIEKFSTAVGGAVQKLTDWFSVTDGGVSRAETALTSFMDGLNATGQAVAAVADIMGGWHNLLIAVGLFMAAPMINAVVGVVFSFARLGVAIGVTTAKMAGFMAIAQYKSFAGFVQGMRQGIGLTKAFNLAWRANPVGLIITGVQMLIGLGAVLYQKFEPFRKMIDGIAKGILDVANFLTGGIAGRVLDAFTGDDGGSGPGPAPASGAVSSFANPTAPAMAMAGGGAIQPPRGEMLIRVQSDRPGVRVEAVHAEHMNLTTETNTGIDWTGDD